MWWANLRKNDRRRDGSAVIGSKGIKVPEEEIPLITISDSDDEGDNGTASAAGTPATTTTTRTLPLPAGSGSNRERSENVAQSQPPRKKKKRSRSIDAETEHADDVPVVVPPSEPMKHQSVSTSKPQKITPTLKERKSQTTSAKLHSTSMPNDPKPKMPIQEDKTRASSSLTLHETSSSKLHDKNKIQKNMNKTSSSSLSSSKSQSAMSKSSSSEKSKRIQNQDKGPSHQQSQREPTTPQQNQELDESRSHHHKCKDSKTLAAVKKLKNLANEQQWDKPKFERNIIPASETSSKKFHYRVILDNTVYEPSFTAAHEYKEIAKDNTASYCLNCLGDLFDSSTAEHVEKVVNESAESNLNITTADHVMTIQSENKAQAPIPKLSSEHTSGANENSKRMEIKDNHFRSLTVPTCSYTEFDILKIVSVPSLVTAHRSMITLDKPWSSKKQLTTAPPTAKNIGKMLIPLTSSIDKQLQSIYKSVEIRDDEYRIAINLVSRIQTVLIQEYDRNCEAVIFRNWYLKLSNGVSNDLIIFVYAYSDNPPRGQPNFYSLPIYSVHRMLMKSCLGQNVLSDVRSTSKGEGKGRGNKFVHSPTEINFQIETNAMLIAEVQLYRLLKHMCQFDWRCRPLLCLVHYWTKVNNIQVGESGIEPEHSYCNVPDPASLDWLVILFLVAQKIIPSPRKVLSRSVHMPILICESRTDIGFAANEDFLQEWLTSKSGKGKEENPWSVLELARNFFRYFSQLQTSKSWFLNTKDGEVLDMHYFATGHIWSKSLTMEEQLMLRGLTPQPDKPHRVNFREWKGLYMMHPLYLSWRLSICRVRWPFVSEIMRITGNELEKVLATRENFEGPTTSQVINLRRALEVQASARMDLKAIFQSKVGRLSTCDLINL